MRVAVDLTALADNFSGIERYAANMARSIALQDTDDELVLLFKESVFPWFEEIAGRPNVEVCVVSRGRGSKAAFSQLALPQALRETRAELALFMAFPCPVLYGGHSVSTVHDLSCHDCPDTMTAKGRLLWRVLDGRATSGDRRVLTISEFSKSRICGHYGKDPSQVAVAYCGIDTGLFNRETGISRKAEVRQRYGLPESPFVLSLSTLEPRKRLDLLVGAWTRLWHEGRRDRDLVLAGRRGWKVDELLAGVPDEAKGHIRFTGFVEDTDLPVLYRMADLFVFPSRYEGFGLPPVEAHDSGARVLCSDIECLREICGDKVAYFRNSDEGDLVRALTDPTLFDEVSDEPLEYSWDTEARKVMRALGLSIDGEACHE